MISLFLIISHESADHGYPILVILFIFPEFIFICAYILLFFNWLEMFVFSHEQFIFDFRGFQRAWKLIFSGTLVIVLILQIVLFLKLCFADDLSKSKILNIIFFVIFYSNLGLPAIFLMLWIYFQFLLLSGFPFISVIALSRVRSLSYACIVWSLGRIARALMLYFFGIQFNWNAVSNDVLSILIVASLVIAEVLPFNLMTDWATVSLLLLADHGDTYRRGDRDASIGDVEAHVQRWEIDLEELQISASGLKPLENQYINTVDGTWRGNQVSVTIFQLAAMNPSVIQDLTSEVASISAISHQYIAKFHGLCVVGSSLYLVNEGLRGGSLQKFIQQSVRPFGLVFSISSSYSI